MAKVIAYCQIWFTLLFSFGFMPSVALSQSLHTAGKYFVFSLPEDASNIGGATSQAKINLHVLSPYEGTGTVNAPNGIRIDFTFKPNTVCEIALPRTLVHTRLSGHAPIGISVQTTAPVNLVLHNILEYAGESTQIWPVESLGKEYVVASWGIFNDQSEDNHAQITITPAYDETSVTITPSVRTLNGKPQDSSFRIVLSRGMSYIIKADTSSGKVSGLSGTHIDASLPISVMTAVTCAYVPIGNQACNMLLDNLLPLEYAGTEFYASPLGDTVRQAYLVFTSREEHYLVSLSDGRTIASSAGRAVIKITKSVRCETTAPSFCHVLTPGFDLVFMSDPSIVTILPTQFYQDTMLWYTPNFLNGGSPFHHTVNVICPTTALASVRLDGQPIMSIATNAPIAGTDHSVTQIVLLPGTHKIISPNPVFAVTSGLFSADAYSFLPMGVGLPTSEVARNSNDYDLHVVVRPNPASKTLSLDVVGIDSNVELTIFNALGNTVVHLQGRLSDLKQIDIAQLPSGSYTLEITSGTHRGRARFLISQ